MRVQEIILENNIKRYLLLDQEGIPVLAAMKYIKYLDKTGKSSNTQKSYCYSLKHFFTYLKEVNKDYKHIRLEDLVDFVGWLRSPYGNAKVAPIKQEIAIRAETTVNHTITVNNKKRNSERFDTQNPSCKISKHYLYIPFAVHR